ncbi:MAG TPA: ParB/RepB/Spo0J family partition protein [Oscillospiraceae bacterium]|nr:ParB/RepB/Spo0J family partition protein [Oscillospiraceae bacterium]HNY00799.1 ParB/RepB/Spo0J family partition protein [Oscillospiraceae bacterium]HPS76332.1 ParB/RepB/Spo0J family partition protein [Oscillospiraceae bacterium]
MANQKKGLGTGLGALLGEDTVPEKTSGGAVLLPLSKVEPRQDQPRTQFDEDALQELADSIALYGVIQPITVRRLDSGYYQIIAGERRWRAARLAGLSEVPVRIIDADDRRAAELALVENLQREDLNPLEEATGYRALIEEFGLTQDEAARSVGKSRSAVTNALRLLALTPKVLSMVQDGRISAGHARALLQITNEKTQAEAADEVCARGLSVRRTEQLAARLSRMPKLPPKEETQAAVDYAADESLSLTKVLARKCKLVEGKRTGRIEIEFYSANDREVLLDNLYRMGNSWQDSSKQHR